MVEVYKTNIQESKEAVQLKAELLKLFPDAKIDFDLEDCDRILRVAYRENIFEEVTRIAFQNGLICEALPD